MEMLAEGIPLVLKKSDWPNSDVEAWDAMFEPCDDWGEGGGLAANWSPGTCKLRLQGYGEWLSYLQRKRPELLALPPPERTIRETVNAYFTEAMERGLRDSTIATKLSSLAEVMHAMAPEGDWTWLRNASNSFLRTSSYQDLKPLPKVTAGQVFTWAVDRLDEVRREFDASNRPVLTAVEFRQALMVAVLMSCPVRQRALLAMTVTEHIERTDGQTVLCFKATDMKDKKARCILLHGRLEGYLLEYLEVHRPILLGGRESPMLWISSRKNDLGADSFSKYLAIYTERSFGEAFRAHKFRHVAATYIAEEMPEHAGIIADILGHAGPRTGEKYYNRAKAIKANRKLRALTARYKELSLSDEGDGK